MWPRRSPRAFALTLGTALALVVGGPGLVAGAAPQDDRAQQLQQQIGEASAQESAALAQLQGIRSRKATIDARVAELDQQLAVAEGRLAPLAADAARIAAASAVLQAKVDRVQSQLDGARHELDVSAAEQYRSARRGSSYDLVIAARPEVLVQQDKYLEHVSQERDAVVQRVTRLRIRVDAQRRRLSVEKAKADAAAAQAQAARDQVASLRSEIEPARAEAASQEQAETDAVEQIQGQKAQYEAELASLQAASDSIAAELRARGSGPGSAGHCEARPVPGPIVSGFGPRYHPILHSTRMHNGADMAASAGTPIHACRAGTVMIAGAEGGYGNAVVIDHGGGMATLYAHQSRIATSVGATVAAGEVIGYVGATGLATGPHLHFEVRLGGNPVDPSSYL
jgi:murein DD-endopeptidase MepM/ murein hydrolase activator NlpD